MKSLKFIKTFLFLISFVAFSVVTFFYKSRNDKFPAPTITQYVVHTFNEVDDDISCHYTVDGYALPSAEDTNFSPRSNSIFFHETSCKGGLNSRQACAVESAARAHPRRQVYVMFSGPISHAIYDKSCLAKLKSFPNVQFARVHILEYAENTPLKSMVAGNPFENSDWPVEHSSDVLRFLTLYKWGGIYLDTDILVVKSLTPLGPNWIARENENFLNAAAIAISMDERGRKLVRAVIKEMRTNYRPDIWSHNGPGAITRVLYKLCNTFNITEWSAKTCQGIEVYPQEYIFPVNFVRVEKYFNRTVHLDNDTNTYTHHLWNKQSFYMKVERGSPFMKMAQELCPAIYEMYGHRFGD